MSCATSNSPGLNFTVQIDNPGSYTVWARGMAPDAGSDSLHVGLNGGTPTTAANLTGFAPNQWSWSRLTMSNTNATLDLSSGGTFTLNISMREDGLRLDKLMLVTDTATIPTGQGPLESPTTNALPNLNSYTIQYGYDSLYRLTDVTYSGDITATYQYEYNEVGNRTTYTATITATQVTTYTYDAANQLITAKEVSSPDTWYYVYDGNGNLVRQVPNELTAADGEVRYTFNQQNLLVQIENHDGSSYLAQAEMNYDGVGNRLQSVSFVLGTAMTTTYTLDSLNNRLPLAVDNGTETRTILYGLFGLGEFSTEWTFYLGDGQLSVRQLMDGSGNIALSRTYGPFGQVLQEAGNGSAIYGFAGAQAGGGGLLYINGRYFDPTTGRFLSPDNNFDPLRPGTLNGYLSAAFLFAPFGVIIWRKRKKRGGRYDLMLFLMLGIGLGMMLVSCAGSEDGGGTPTRFFGTDTPIVPGQPPALAPTSSSTPSSPTGTLTNPPASTPNNPDSPTPTPCPTPTYTPTPDSVEQKINDIETNFSFVKLRDLSLINITVQPWVIDELIGLEGSLQDVKRAMGPSKALSAFGVVEIYRDAGTDCFGNRAAAGPDYIRLCDIAFWDSSSFRTRGIKKTVAHELGHIWDARRNNALRNGIINDPGIFQPNPNSTYTRLEDAPGIDNEDFREQFGEEWADSFAVWVLVNSGQALDMISFDLGVDRPWPAHQAYVQKHYDALP